MARPSIDGVAGLLLRICGVHLGYPGPVEVRLDGRKLGQVSGEVFKCDLPSEGSLPVQLPQLALVSGDDGVWYLPQRVELMAKTRGGKLFRVAEWSPRCESDGDIARREIRLPLGWCRTDEVIAGTARFVARDAKTGGQWPGRFGSKAVWFPQSAAGKTVQNGYQLQVCDAETCLWNGNVTGDARVPAPFLGQNAVRPATCWHHSDKMTFEIIPPDIAPYRLTVYVMDFDRHGREMSLSVTPQSDLPNAQTLSKQDTLGGTSHVEVWGHKRSRSRRSLVTMPSFPASLWTLRNKPAVVGMCGHSA